MCNEQGLLFQSLGDLRDSMDNLRLREITVVVKENAGKRVGLTLPARWQKDGGDLAGEAAAYIQTRKSAGRRSAARRRTRG